MEFSSTEHAVTWFRDAYRDGTLDIRPPYQRAPVWAERQKNALIESILLGLPIPEVYIEQVVDQNGETTHGVVDGQQRVRTILQFLGVDEEEEEDNDFALDKLGATSPWQGMRFADLEGDDKQLIWKYRFAVRQLESATDAEVRDMFKRLNKYSMPLRPQELRNATYIGPFAKLAESLADESDYWAENSIVTTQAIRRMGDIEFVAELLIGTMHGPQAGSASVIDDYYTQYEDFDDEFPEQRATKRRFNVALLLVQRLFPNIRKTRWSNKTDFYSLFVVFAYLLREYGDTSPNGRMKALRAALGEFEQHVEDLLADEKAKVPGEIVQYVRAVTRGANDKNRRGERHTALLTVLRPIFDE